MPLEKFSQITQKTTKIWTIKNVQPDFGVNDSLEDANLFYEFSSEFDHNDKWQVHVKFVRRPQDNKHWVITNVYPITIPVIHHSVSTHYYLHKDNFYKPIARNIYKKGSIEINRYSSHVVTDFDHGKSLNELIANDTLQLRIQLVTYLEDEPVFPPSAPFVIPHYPRTVTSDSVQELYENRNVNHDLIIKVQQNEFRAHRHILEQFYPALYELINHNDNVLNITDVSSDVFKMVLEYIYTGFVNDLDDNAELLLKASHRLGLEILKHFCEESLADNYVTFNNLNELWVLIRRYRSVPLNQYGRALLNDYYMFNASGRFHCDSQTLKELERKYIHIPFYQLTNDLKREVYCPPDIL